MVEDNYWNKFLNDGSVQSYLEYKEHLKKQESGLNGTDTVFNRRSDYQGTTNR
jgi:hypothetical protein